jgi:hypothetical protein
MGHYGANVRRLQGEESGTEGREDACTGRRDSEEAGGQGLDLNDINLVTAKICCPPLLQTC